MKQIKMFVATCLLACVTAAQASEPVYINRVLPKNWDELGQRQAARQEAERQREEALDPETRRAQEAAAEKRKRRDYKAYLKDIGQVNYEE